MNRNELLTATYTAAYRRIVVRFFDGGAAEVATLGDVTDAEIEAAVAAQGGDVDGFTCELA